MFDQQDREAALDNYDFSFVREKMVREGTLTSEAFRVVEQEFKKFLKLVLREDGPLAMIDRRVDELWHSFILFTPQYRRFCVDVMGFFVDHQPRTSMTPVPTGAIKNFVDAYKRQYGELGPFWLEDLDPSIRHYVERGTVPQDLSFDWSGWTGRPPLSFDK